MRVFKDVFTGAEILSDSYKIEQLYEQVVGVVKARLVVKK